MSARHRFVHLDRKNLPHQEGASIDRETENGKTALISAAEEDPQAPGHTWVQNEEGWEVLAAALLLDRRIHRPKVRNTCIYARLGRVDRASESIERDHGSGTLATIPPTLAGGNVLKSSCLPPDARHLNHAQ